MNAEITPNSCKRPARHQRRMVAAVAIALIAAGCGDDNSSAPVQSPSPSDATVATTATTGTSTGTGTNAAVTTTTVADDDAVVAASDQLVDICRTRDRDRLRDLSGARTRDRLRDQDMTRIFAENVENIVVTDRSVNIDGDTATVTVLLEVTIDGTTSEIERTWLFEKVDGVWVLADIPDCAFK